MQLAKMVAGLIYSLDSNKMQISRDNKTGVWRGGDVWRMQVSFSLALYNLQFNAL